MACQAIGAGDFHDRLVAVPVHGVTTAGLPCLRNRQAGAVEVACLQVSELPVLRGLRLEYHQRDRFERGRVFQHFPRGGPGNRAQGLVRAAFVVVLAEGIDPCLKLIQGG